MEVNTAVYDKEKQIDSLSIRLSTILARISFRISLLGEMSEELYLGN